MLEFFLTWTGMLAKGLGLLLGFVIFPFACLSNYLICFNEDECEGEEDE